MAVATVIMRDFRILVWNFYRLEHEMDIEVNVGIISWVQFA